MNNKFKEIGKIYETMDYDAFSFLHFNRNAKPRKDLLDALEKYGRFFEPIIVNEDLEVLDGQHRLLSAKLKETPISFYVVDDATAKQVIKSVNTERRSWTTREYIDFYDRLGNQNFITLNEYLNSEIQKKLPDSMIQEVLAGKGSQFTKIKDGTYKIGSLEEADKTFEFMADVMEGKKGKMGVRIGRVIRTLFLLESINKKRLHRVLSNERTHKQIKNSSEDSAIEYVMSEYNKGLTTNYVEYYFDKRGSFQVIK